MGIIKMDLKRNRKGSIERIDLVQYTDKWQTPVNMVMNLQVTYNIDNFLIIRGIIGFPQKPLFH